MGNVEAWCLAAIVAAAVGFMILERLRPYNPDQGMFRTGFWTDLLEYGFAQSYVMGVLIGRLLAVLDRRTGWSERGTLANWSVAKQILFFLVVHDIYIYWFHRLQHRSPMLWRIHEAHHSVPQVDWLSGVRSHALEILINQTVEFAPIILLGAAPVVPVVKGTISAIWGMFIHSNVDARLGRLQYLINGPEMHRWHHATDDAAQGMNFSTKFAVWDWLFGTAYFPDRDRSRAGQYGLTEQGFPESFPAGYFRQHARAFQRRHPK